MGQEFSEKVEIWDQWNGIHYIPIHNKPFSTKGSSVMGEKWENEPTVEDHQSFYYYDIEWTPERMTFKIDGEIVRDIDNV